MHKILEMMCKFYAVISSKHSNLFYIAVIYGLIELIKQIIIDSSFKIVYQIPKICGII